MARAGKAGGGASQLFKLWPGAGSGLTVAQMRYLGRVFLVFRWGGGIGLVALASLLVPPKHPYWLAVLILWVAAYNGSATVAVNRLDNDSIHAALRATAVIDALSYFVLLRIFLGNPPGALVAVYPTILIESIAFDAAWGAIYSAALFVVGFAALEISQQRLNVSDLILWSAVMVIIATSLTILSQVMVGQTAADVPQPDGTLAHGRRLGLVTGAPRLSTREQEVLKLVAEGYSNGMIASRLRVSENTVKGHVEGLLSRLNARNRAEAVAAAGRLDLL